MTVAELDEIHVSPPTVADLIDRLGGISPDRILMSPTPGTATEADCIGLLENSDRLYELVDGVIVEKAAGFTESLLVMFLAGVIGNFVAVNNLGLIAGPDGFMRLFPGSIRAPDLAFIAWGRFPDGKRPTAAVPATAPDLAIEVLSERNTQREMLKKRRDYFKGGVVLVWSVDPRKRIVEVYREAEKPALTLTVEDQLSGDDVLKGFSLSVRDLFTELRRTAPQAS